MKETFLCSHLIWSHCVKPGKPTPDYPRITIAFNFRVLEYEGEKYD